jgi:murein DD-endopeptidase MepM/ murein hydrolase activator NlpD
MELLALLFLAGLLLKKTTKQFSSPVTPLKITSKFGKREDPFNVLNYTIHTGVDIYAPLGTPVKAANSGRVHIWTDELSGNAIKIKDKNGFTFGYAHLSKILVKDLQSVVAGQIIGLSGSTGHSTGPHLHFNIRDNTGKYLDPEKYI